MRLHPIIMKTILLLKLLHAARSFMVTAPNANVTANEGDTVELLCQADSSWEYCIWRHKSENCEYMWTYSTGKVTRQRCSIGKRVKFLHQHYNKHECRILLKDVKRSDEGLWRCEMESYYWGAIRGYTGFGNITLNIEERPEVDMDTTDTATFGFSSAESSVLESTPSLSVEDDMYVYDLDDATVIEAGNETWTEDDYDNFFNLTRPNPIVGQGEEPAQTKKEEFHDITTIVSVCGTFLALFIIVVLAVLVIVRRNQKRRKSVLDVDWNEKKEEEVRRLELNDIIEEDEKDKDADEPKLKINVTEQKMTYQGSTAMSFEKECDP